MVPSPGLTVLLPVYWRDDPVHTRLALESVIVQTVAPHEVLIIKDGPVTDAVERELRALAERHPTIIRGLQLPENRGLGYALSIGVKEATNEIIARMDADDLADPTRFQKQLDVMTRDSNLSLVGAQIREFSHTPGDLALSRRVPIDQVDILRYAKWRNPFNHMSVMYRRTAVLDAGNYQSAPQFEDYHLWVRMLMAGDRVRNLNDVLVDVRTHDLAKRRGGRAYLRSEIQFRKDLAAWGFITPFEGFISATMAAGIRMAPSELRQLVYARLLRTRV